jgi:hypothetical protein
MSYCRFSSENFASDVYVYESVAGGFVTHVAGSRVIGEVPKLLRPTKENADEYLDARLAQSKFLDSAEYADIELEHAGESFSDDTAAECADRLESLRAIGYHVPQSAIDALREEAADAQVPAHAKGEMKADK